MKIPPFFLMVNVQIWTAREMLFCIMPQGWSVIFRDDHPVQVAGKT